MFRYYLCTIGLAMTVVAFCTAFFGGASPLLAVLLVLLAVAAVFAIDALVAIATRWCMPREFDPFSPLFRVRRWERRLYVRMGIRRWKDKIPETGALLGYLSKKEITDRTDNSYLLHFMRETCYAEVMHALSLPLGFAVLALSPLFDFPFCTFVALPVAAVNAVLQLLPICVQRYVRPFLVHAYRYNEKKAKKKEQE